MSAPYNRRQFLSQIAATGAAASLAAAAPPERTAQPIDRSRIPNPNRLACAMRGNVRTHLPIRPHAQLVLR